MVATSSMQPPRSGTPSARHAGLLFSLLAGICAFACSGTPPTTPELDDGFRLYLEGEQGLFVFEDVTIGSSNFERVFVEGTRLEIAEGWLDAPRFAERSDADCFVAIHDLPSC